jgi:hypothetical protein
MRDEEFLKCPLIEGLDGMHRAELLGLIENSTVREKLEKCVSHLAQATTEAQESFGNPEKQQPMDFKKEVHTWNPTQPIWRRSSKE